MSKVGIIVIIAFLIIVYIFTFLKLKKRRESYKTTFAGQFNKTLINRESKIKINKKNSKELSNYQKQITKYNSPEDYREKDSILDEIDRYL